MTKKKKPKKVMEKEKNEALNEIAKNLALIFTELRKNEQGEKGGDKRMKCEICGKPIKENTDGDKKYCQGHDLFEIMQVRNREKIERDADRPGRAYTY